MKKILIFSLILLSFFTKDIFAQTPTENEKINEEEVKKIRETVQQKVNEKLQNIENKTINQKISILGTITKIEDDIISIERKNTTRSVKIVQDTTIVNLKKTTAKINDLVVGQDIIALGYRNKEEVLEAKRIVFVNKKDAKIDQVVSLGKVVDMSQTSPVFVFIPNKNKDIQYQVNIDSKTTFITNREKQKLTSKEIKAGTQMIVSLTPNPENNKSFTARYIIILN